jgi:hypothetical protein
MGGVEFVPCEPDAGGIQRIVYGPSSVCWHMRVLPAKHHQQFTPDLAGTL